MSNTPKLSHDAIESVVELYQSGAPVRVIAESHGVSAATVRSTVRRAGVTLRPVGRPRNKAVSA